ncbi:cupin-like domain-containing protein [Tribonema minus]|uniref:Cupin-like domain-containing protein n=1 Tax=Tribonema minus TaxID=303371 RepID=A0A836CK29_9STRA|nr:cupin-like domain-containing protein [Tribonema minus]
MRVEHRQNHEEGFGRGRERVMTLAAFLDAIAGGDTLLYLTTQELEVSADGRPDIISTPITHLHADFPLRPQLLATLVPQNMNLWAGHSGEGADGSSTGLHHDYHDNLYVLLRGRKRFKLWSPDAAPNMYTVGTIARVHTNGRINYMGQLTRADGADEDAEAASAAADRARLDAAEEALEAALEAVLDAECGAGAPQGATFADYPSMADHVSSSEGSGDDESSHAEEDYDVHDSSDDDAIAVAGKVKRSVSCIGAQSERSTKKATTGDVSPPDNFSQVDLKLSEQQIKQQYPLFAAMYGCEAEVLPGQMLYLPAGWFHEVTSYSSSKDAAADCPGHLAFNYWYHPPDIEGTYEKPYLSDFWEKDWTNRTGNGRGVEGLYTNLES